MRTNDSRKKESVSQTKGNWSNFIHRTVEEYKDKVKTDSLQRLHTVSNLKELLSAGHESLAPTLRDDQASFPLSN